jgi:RNA polymerase sigma-70 factor (ECF subfamily)
VTQRSRFRRQMVNQGALDDVSSQDAPDDRQLVVSALANPAGFERLFSKYWGPILRYCAWRLADPADAEDAAIRVLTNAFAALPQFASGTGVFRAWLFTIARNEVINTYRLQARHDNDRIPDELELIDPAPTPEQHALVSDEGHRLRVLLTELPQRSREVVELRLVGFTDREIAAVLGISDGAVRQAQSRAMGSLRQLVRTDRDMMEGRHV